MAVQLRVTGTAQECEQFTAALLAATAPGVVREVSGFYPNRGASVLGRVYLDLDLPPTADATDPPASPGRPPVAARPSRRTAGGRGTGGRRVR